MPTVFRAMVLTALAVVGLPQFLLAGEEGRRPGPPGLPDLDRVFQQLDANHDGVISEEEISKSDAPEPFKAMWKRAAKKGDGKVTLDQLRAAMKEFRPDGPAGAREGRRHAGPESAEERLRHRSPDAAEGHHRFGPPHEGRLGGPPDLKSLFERMDKDKDGKLNFEEFSEGMKQVHSDMMAHFGGRGWPAGAPGFPGPWGGGPHAPFGQWGHGAGGAMGWAHGGMMGGGPHGPMMHGGWQGFPGPMGWGGGPQPWRGPHGPMMDQSKWTEEQKKAWEARREAWQSRRGGEGSGAAPNRPGFHRPFGPGGPLPPADLDVRLKELEKKIAALEAKLKP